MIGYHDIGKSTDPKEWIISHSQLNLLDPLIGGHPTSFFSAMLEGQKKETPSMERGTLLHSYLENPKEFIISEQNKPTPQIALLIETFFNLYTKSGWKNNSVFLAEVDLKQQIDSDSLEAFKVFYPFVYNNDLPLPSDWKNNVLEDFVLFVKCFRFSRKDSAYNSSHKEPTVIKAFMENIGYYEFLKQANGLIILDKATKNILTNCYNSVSKHPFASKLLFEPNPNAFNEQEIFWTAYIGNTTIKRKGKIDRYIINQFDRTVKIIDFKTTAYPVQNFRNLDGAYHKYKLGRQLANYEIGLKESNEELEKYNFEHYNVVVQTTGENPTMVYKTDFHNIYQYSLEIISLQKRLGFHINNNIWHITMEEQEKGFQII